MKTSLSRLVLALTLSFLLSPQAATAAPQIEVGTFMLEADAPGQEVQIFVTGGDAVEGLNLLAQVADGGPELGGVIDGPAITDLDIITGTIFADNNTGQRGDIDLANTPQFAAVATTTASGTVSADGLLCTITLDTTGFFEGTFDLNLGNTLAGATDFALIQIEIFDGSIELIPLLTADAGEDRTVVTSQTVQLEGSGTDPDDLPLAFSWVQTAGPGVVLSDPGIAQPTFVAPIEPDGTQLVFELTVSNGTETDTDSVTFTLVPPNNPPTVDAGADQTVEPGATVELTGSGSDPEGLAVTYQWTQTDGSSVVLSGATDTTASFSVPADLASSTFTFQLSVSDGVNTATDEVTVMVSEPPETEAETPIADAGADQEVDPGEVVELDGSGTDEKGQSVAYQWSQIGGRSVSLSDPTAVNPTFRVPDDLVNAELVFELRVSNGSTASADTITVFVLAMDDSAPIADAGPDQTVDAGTTVQLDGTAFDADDDDLDLLWVQLSGPKVVLSDATAEDPTFSVNSSLANTKFVFEFRASDLQNTSSDTVTITVNANNQAPTANAGSDQTVDAGSTVQLDGSGNDPEGATLSYQWTQTDGTPVTLSDSEITNPTFTAPDAVTNTRLTFQLAVSDGETNALDEVIITVAADVAVIAADAGVDKTAEAGSIVQLSGKDANNTSGDLTYEWIQISGPAVMLDNPFGATTTFTAPEGLTNTELVFELRITQDQTTSIDTVAVTIGPNADGPVAEAGADQSVVSGDTVQLDGTASGPEGETLAYQWIQQSGSTVELDNATSAMPSFTAPPVDAETTLQFELEVTLNDETSSDEVSITVRPVSGGSNTDGQGGGGGRVPNKDDRTSSTSGDDSVRGLGALAIILGFAGILLFLALFAQGGLVSAGIIGGLIYLIMLFASADFERLLSEGVF